MLKVVHEESESNAHAPVGVGGSLLDGLVRDGARAMLAAALQAEVAAYIDAHAGEVDEAGYRLVVRNGYHQPREVATAAGAVPVRAPRGERQAPGRGERAAAAVLVGDPAGVGAQVPAGCGGVAAAVPARPVQRRLRPGVGAVPRLGCGLVRGHGDPADGAVAGRGGGVQPAFLIRRSCWRDDGREVLIPLWSRGRLWRSASAVAGCPGRCFGPAQW